MKETIFKQIETYSNGIVAFIVLQGLAFSFYYGTSEIFNCRVKSSNLLAEILVILFVVITMLSIIAVKYLGNRMADLFPEYQSMMIVVTKGKIVIISVFGLFPAFITVFYGVLVEVPKACEKLIL